MISDDHGFTLAEAMTALLIVALAMAGLAQAAHLIGLQARQADKLRGGSQDLARLQRVMASAPDGLGPFVAGGARFEGEARRAAFDCGQAAPCILSLEQDRITARWPGRSVSAPLTPRAQLRYVDDTGAVQTRWPQGETRRLTAVAIVDGSAPLAILRLPASVAPTCLANGRGRACETATKRGDDTAP